MKAPLICTLIMLAIASPRPSLAAAPANDSFFKATILAPNADKLLNQTGVASTADALDPYIGGVKLTRSVWYQFDATATATNAKVIIDDHVGVRAAVFRLADPDGSAGALSFLTQTTNTVGGDIDMLTFATTVGQRYYICVEANGLFDLTLRVPGKINDDFSDAITLVGDEGTVTGSNVGATDLNDSPPSPPFTTPINGVWYAWTPSFTGLAVVDTNFSGDGLGGEFSTVLNVFTGSALAALVPVAGDTDGGLGNNSRVVFSATAGTTYRIWAGGAGPVQDTFYLSYFAEGNGGVFDIAKVATQVSETQGPSMFLVRRFRAGNVAASVTIKTANVTATGGPDYTVINSILNFPDPTTSDTGTQQNVTMIIVPDNILENTETFTLSLSAATAGATIGVSSPTTVSILKPNTAVAAGFLTNIIRVREGVGQVVIPLTRSEASGVADTRIKHSLGALAKAGRDFLAVDTTVMFSAGQTQGVVTLTILDDGFFEGTETIVLTATPVTPMPLSGYNEITIIVDDDEPPFPMAGRLAATLDDGGIIGTVDVTITTKGTVSGKVVMAKGSLPFTGTFVNGRLTVRLGADTAPMRTLTIEVLHAENKTYQVTLNDGELGTTVSRTINATNFNSLTPCTVAGYYTFADTAGGGGVPQLIAASIKVEALGTVTLSGKLYDGTPVVASGAVNTFNQAMIGATLYSGNGRATVQANLRSTLQSVSGATFSLLRPGRANQSVELPAVQISAVSALVARYVPPGAAQRVLTVWNPAGAGNADLTGGGFGGLTTKAITVSTMNKVTVTNLLPEKLSLTLTTSSGFFSGSVIPTGATKPKTIYGVLLQGGVSSFGYGFFLNDITPGRIKLRGP